jgi:hypothetical protein
MHIACVADHPLYRSLQEYQGANVKLKAFAALVKAIHDHVSSHLYTPDTKQIYLASTEERKFLAREVFPGEEGQFSDVALRIVQLNRFIEDASQNTLFYTYTDAKPPYYRFGFTRDQRGRLMVCNSTFEGTLILEDLDVKCEYCIYGCTVTTFPSFFKDTNRTVIDFVTTPLFPQETVRVHAIYCRSGGHIWSYFSTTNIGYWYRYDDLLKVIVLFSVNDPQFQKEVSQSISAFTVW